MNGRALAVGRLSRSRPWWTALALAIGTWLLVRGGAAQAGDFPSLPLCSDCPAVLDDPAKLGVAAGATCKDDFRWGFRYLMSDTVTVTVGSVEEFTVPLQDFVDPVSHDFEIWLFLGPNGLPGCSSPPCGCTSQTCLYQSIRAGRFVKTGDGKYIYRDSGATLGGARFISSITLAPQAGGTMHVSVRGFVAPPAAGDVSLVLTQIGNIITSPGGRQVQEPPLSLGIDRRNLPWKQTSCGWRLHNVGGSAPQVLCACILPPPPPPCPERAHAAPVAVSERVSGTDRFALHLAFTPTDPAPPSQKSLVVTFKKTNAPAFAVDVAALEAGDLAKATGRYIFRSPDLDVTLHSRSNDQLVLDLIAQVPLPPAAPQDDLLVSISLGTDVYETPGPPALWSYDANHSLVLKAGAQGLPICTD